MEEENYKRWITVPDACRCCLAASGTWDLTTGYAISTDGVKEVFSDLLFDCFGLSLSLLQEWCCSRMICGLCLGRLRDANAFREQVRKCEAFYAEYNKTTGFAKVKVEVESLNEDVDMKDEVSDDESKNNFKLETEQKSADALISPTTDNKVKTTTKSKKNKVLKRNMKRSTKKSQTSGFCEVIIDENASTKIEVEVSPPQPSEAESTHIRNSRLRHNMKIMLKNSTIIPFRYLINTNNQYTCQYCDEKYFEFEELRRHVHEKHCNISESEILKTLKYPVDFVKAEITDIRCRVCDTKQENLDALADHLLKDHNKDLRTVDFKPFHGVLGFTLDRERPLCQMCFKEFSNLRRLISHTSEHCQNFACKLCTKKFLSKRMLSVHLLQHNEKKTFACKFCDKTFEVVGSRTYHMKKEHNYGMHKCSECGKGFIQFDQRAEHLQKVHNIRKPSVHFCEICSKEYANSSTLKKHMMYTHWNVKKFVCDLCGKSFTFKNCLTKHLRVHSGEKPFECNICNKKFGQQNTLRVHLRGHANDKRYVCEACGTAFIQKHCLKRHYTTHHPDSVLNSS